MYEIAYSGLCEDLEKIDIGNFALELASKYNVGSIINHADKLWELKLQFCGADFMKTFDMVCSSCHSV